MNTGTIEAIISADISQYQKAMADIAQSTTNAMR